MFSQWDTTLGLLDSVVHRLSAAYRWNWAVLWQRLARSQSAHHVESTSFCLQKAVCMVCAIGQASAEEQWHFIAWKCHSTWFCDVSAAYGFGACCVASEPNLQCGEMVAWSSFESCHKRWQISEWPSYCQAIRRSDRFEFSGRTFRSMSHWKQAGCGPSQAAWIWKVEKKVFSQHPNQTICQLNESSQCTSWTKKTPLRVRSKVFLVAHEKEAWLRVASKHGTRWSQVESGTGV